ncbi:MAG: hypothetical protein WKG07_49985 [Hymenobacter sp.]
MCLWRERVCRLHHPPNYLPFSMTKYLTLLACLAALPLLAQPTPKKPLDHTVYDAWQSVANQRVSPNGKHVLFQVKPQQGDGILHLVTAANRSLRLVGRGDSAQFSADSRFAVFQIKPRYQDVRQARIKKKSPTRCPRTRWEFTGSKPAS